MCACGPTRVVVGARWTFRRRGLNRHRPERQIVVAAPTKPETLLPASGVLAKDSLTQTGHSAVAKRGHP